jgi:hypothetical protein
MPATPTISNIPYPQSRFLDPVSQGPAREWIQWLQNPYVVTQTVQYLIVNGGEINNTVIGNVTPAAGTFTLLTALVGIGGGTF